MKHIAVSLVLALGLVACGSDSDGGGGDELSEDQQSCSFEGVCKRCRTMEALRACSTNFEDNPCETVEASFCAD